MIFYNPCVIKECANTEISPCICIFIEYLEKNHKISLLTRRSHIINGTNYSVDI